MMKTFEISKHILAAILLFLSITTLIFASQASSDNKNIMAENSIRPVYLVEVEGVITTGQKNFIGRQFENAVDTGSQLLIIRINTPGGLVDATMKINELILNVPIPVAVLVAPSGAIAGSAGTFILMASDIAAMAPGTTIGAAQPVAMSPGGAEEAGDKTVTFYASYMRNTAEEQGRPGDIAERFVTENLSLGSGEALEKGMIEYLAGNVHELLNEIDGKEIEKLGEIHKFNTADAPIVQGEMTTAERLQDWLGNPQIAFLILMAGFLGIYLGLSAPGTIVPEVGGLILLILGIYGIGLFDVNTTGIILLLVGLGLIMAEIFTSGFGVLGIGGAISLVIGAIMLPVEPLMATDWYRTFIITVGGVTLGLVLIMVVVIQRIIKSRRKPTGGSEYFNPPEKGVTVSELNPEGRIKARGEHWRARSIDDSTIPAGKEVKVVKAETLMLWVQLTEKEKKSNADNG
jgi:membrane-bound serine protease (ClpP class)